MPTQVTPEELFQLFSSPGAEATVPAASNLPTQSVDPAELLGLLEETKPGKMEQLVGAVGGLVRDIGQNVVDIGSRARGSTGALLEAGAGISRGVGEAVGLSPERLEEQARIQRRIIQAVSGQQEAISPEQAEESLLGSSLDAATLSLGMGLGRLASSPVLAGLTRSSSLLTRILGRSAIGALSGAGVGVSPVFAPRGQAGEALPTSERLPAQLEAGAEFGAFGGALEGVALPVVAAGARGVGKRLFSPEAITRRFGDAAAKLNDTQLVRNTYPQAARQLAHLSDLLVEIRGDVMDRVAARLASRTGRPLSGAARTSALNKAYREEMRGVVGDVREAVKEQLAITRGITQALEKRSKKLGLDPKLSRGILAQSQRLLSAMEKGEFKEATLNGTESLINHLNEFTKRTVALEQQLMGRDPLAVLKDVFKKGAPVEERFRNALTSVRNNLFGYLSFAQDSVGNAVRLGSEVATRGVLDTVDVLTGNAAAAGRLRSVLQATKETFGPGAAKLLDAVGGQRMAAAVNRIRNRTVTTKFVNQIRPLFAAGEEIGPAGNLNMTDRALDLVLFGGVKGKGVVDTLARRFGARIALYDEAYAAAAKAGVSGAERELFVRNFLRGGLSGELPGAAQTRVLDFANKMAFIVPRGQLFTRLADNPATALFVSPFIRFSAAAMEWLAEYIPVIGFGPALKRAAKGEALTLASLKDVMAKQLVGAGALDFVDKTLYDNVTFTDFGPRYVDPDSGRERLLPSPLSDIIMINAAVRGDMQRFRQAASNSSLMFLGGGLLSNLVKELSEPGGVSPEKAANDWNRTLELLVPGRAMLLLLNGLFTDYQEEPFTQGGQFLPLVNVVPGQQGRERIRLGGGFEPSTAKLLGTDVEVPRALGSIVTEKELNNAELTVRFAEKRIGRKRFNMFSTPRAVKFDEQQIDFSVLDERIQRSFQQYKQAYLGVALGGLAEQPHFRSLEPPEMERWMRYHNAASNQYAAAIVSQLYGAQITPLGELEEQQ